MRLYYILLLTFFNRVICLVHRIVGGTRIHIEDNPFHVALFQSKKMTSKVFCGGSIISPNWVITAAHCVEWLDTVYVLAGKDNICQNRGTLIKSDKIIINPIFDNIDLSGDVALIYFDEPIEFNSSINSINMISSNENIDEGEIVKVMGFGARKTGGKQGCRLLGTSVIIRNHDKCSEIYETPLTDQFCAGVPNGGKDTCQGDSGGPAIIENGNSKILIGITSYGNRCALKRYPGIYTDLRLVKKWIDKTTGI